MKRFLAMLAFAASVFTFAVPAYAAKPTPSGTVTLDQTNVHFGDTITFTYVYDARLDSGNSRVQNVVGCDDGLIVHEWSLVAALDEPLVLSSYDWTSGPAECFAELVDVRGNLVVRLDRIEFHVAA